MNTQACSLALEFIGLRFLVFLDFLKAPSVYPFYLLVLNINEIETNCNMIENIWITKDENTM